MSFKWNWATWVLVAIGLYAVAAVLRDQDLKDGLIAPSHHRSSR